MHRNAALSLTTATWPRSALALDGALMLRSLEKRTESRRRTERMRRPARMRRGLRTRCCDEACGRRTPSVLRRMPKVNRAIIHKFNLTVYSSHPPTLRYVSQVSEGRHPGLLSCANESHWLTDAADQELCAIGEVTLLRLAFPWTTTTCCAPPRFLTLVFLNYTALLLPVAPIFGRLARW